ncbi:MAG TPA: hypothetical protein VLE96_00470, partial [Chlamydiales bacterium]|nr:hypothetical protein [Chlamydiales bacterium]
MKISIVKKDFNHFFSVYAIVLDMALPPQKFREIVFQILFSSDSTEETALMLMAELKVTKKAVL